MPATSWIDIIICFTYKTCSLGSLLDEMWDFHSIVHNCGPPPGDVMIRITN